MRRCGDRAEWNDQGSLMAAKVRPDGPGFVRRGSALLNQGGTADSFVTHSFAYADGAPSV